MSVDHEWVLNIKLMTTSQLTGTADTARHAVANTIASVTTDKNLIDKLFFALPL